MSSLFQANLEGNDFARNPLGMLPDYQYMFIFLTIGVDIAYGSRLTLKNMGWGGGLLHSHVQSYPGGSNQQQVTCYHYKDDNNQFTILPRWDEPPYNPNDDMKFLKDGDVIRLNHVPTTRNIHSHTVLAPISKLNYEVSCYGNDTIGDKHDYWKVEVVDDINRGTNFDRIHSLTTRLRFKHEALGCYLRAANAILPQWGFKQVEVSCDKENNPKDTHTYWNVESHWNDRCMCFDDVLNVDDNAKFLFSSTTWRTQILQITFPPRLLAPQCGDDDIQQRSHSRPRQGRYPCLQTF